jgi:hypothetical protein
MNAHDPSPTADRVREHPAVTLMRHEARVRRGAAPLELDGVIAARMPMARFSRPFVRERFADGVAFIVRHLAKENAA